jgi:hypothetical protein
MCGIKSRHDKEQKVVMGEYFWMKFFENKRSKYGAYSWLQNLHNKKEKDEQNHHGRVAAKGCKRRARDQKEEKQGSAMKEGEEEK